MANVIQPAIPARRRFAPEVVRVLQEIKNQAERATPFDHANVNMDATISQTPDWIKPTFFIIQPSFTTVNGVQVDDTRETFLKKLMKLFCRGTPGYLDSLMIMVAAMTCLNPGFGRDARIVLRDVGANLIEATVEDLVQTYPGLEDAHVEDLSVYDGAEPSHYVYFFSLAITLIGKQLEDRNYNNWKERRKRSFGPPLGLLPNDEMLEDLVPYLEMANKFNSDVRIFWKMRRLFFMNAWALSKRTDLVGAGMKVTIILLKGAEMTNWVLISHWVCLLNPDILLWNELGKFVPFICAAYSKWTALGELAPWAKMIMPSEQLAEFRYDKLATVFTVAREIAAEYGSTSMRNLGGSKTDGTIHHIVSQAMHIVRMAGGARTIDVMAMRLWRYNGYNNAELNAVQDRGAMVRHIEDEDIDERPNLAAMV